MIVEPKILNQALRTAAQVAGKNTTMPVLNCVLLSAASGVLTVRASDLTTWITVKIPCTGELESIAVPAGILQKIVGGSTVDIEITAVKSRLQVVSRGRSELACLDAGESPSWPGDGMRSIGVNCADLADAIESVAWAADPGVNGRPALENVSVELTDTTLAAVAATGACLARNRRPAVCAPAKFLIHAGLARQLCACLRETGAVLALGENYVGVSHDNGSLFCKLTNDRYPETDIMFRDLPGNWDTVTAEPLVEAMETCVALNSTTGTKSVSVEPGADGMKIRFESPSGKFETVIPGSYKSAAATFFPSRMLTVCRALAGEFQTGQTDRMSPRHFNAGNLSILLMPTNPGAR